MATNYSQNPVVLNFENENDSRHIQYIIDFESNNVCIRENIEEELFETNCGFLEFIEVFEVIASRFSHLQAITSLTH